jgi:hypothetical protein
MPSLISSFLENFLECRPAGKKWKCVGLHMKWQDTETVAIPRTEKFLKSELAK